MRLDFLKSPSKSLVDLMPYLLLPRIGVVLTKDGSFLAGFYYEGPDNDSQLDMTLNVASQQFSRCFTRLGGNWTVHTDAIRRRFADYPTPDDVHFPDEITRAIDDERRQYFTRDGHHFQSLYAMVLHYMPPPDLQTRLKDMMLSKHEKIISEGIPEALIDEFIDNVTEFTKDLQANGLIVDMMGDYTVSLNDNILVQRSQLVNYLNLCICGESNPINLLPSAPYLDGYLGCYDFVTGYEPFVDNKSVIALSIDSFPSETYPAILSVLDNFPFEYRWSNRFIILDSEQAEKEFNAYRRKWEQKRTPLLQQIFKVGSGVVDQHATEMMHEAEAGLSVISKGEVAFGYYTGTIILMNEDRSVINAQADDIIAAIRRIGFNIRKETLNTVEAWLGSLPGNNYCNVRRPIIHTRNLSDMLPFSSMWTGSEYNPCPMYPNESPALFFADTIGYTAFQANFHVGDVGHTLIIGPTGSGKSTLLAFVAAQFRKYAESQIIIFDKGDSLYCLTRAVGGRYYDIGADDTKFSLCPLQDIDTDNDQSWAVEWLKMCCELQLNRSLQPEESSKLQDAVRQVRHSAEKSLTTLCNQLQDIDLKEALRHYTLAGPMGTLLDGETDDLSVSNFTCFELEELMNNQSDKNKLPVLLYLFQRVKKQLTGKPSMIILDEAWMMLSHEKFKDKIIEWLKVMRKNNCMIVMATQSLGDATKSNILDVIAESTATKIFLPNPQANTDVSRKVYESIGLNARQIDIIANATPKREYYLVTNQNDNRLFELSLGKIALAFVGQSGIEAKRRLLEFEQQYGDNWVNEWLRQHTEAA